MAPIIHCVRHAQGLHNLSVENRSLPDPVITELGEQQCIDLASSFESHSRISLIVASPLVRTLQTALLSFGDALSNGHCAPTIIALPEAQEVSNLIADTGSDIERLTEICQRNGWPVDLSLIPHDWNNKSLPRWEPEYDALSQRAREARIFIWEKACQLQNEGQESPEIVFVTHGGFLNYFTEDWEGSGVDSAYREGRPSDVVWGMPGTAWRNTEVRSYYIEGHQTGPDFNPQLIETPESRQRRGKDTSGQDQPMGKLSLDAIRKRSRPANVEDIALPRSHI